MIKKSVLLVLCLILLVCSSVSILAGDDESEPFITELYGVMYFYVPSEYQYNSFQPYMFEVTERVPADGGGYGNFVELSAESVIFMKFLQAWGYDVFTESSSDYFWGTNHISQMVSVLDVNSFFEHLKSSEDKMVYVDALLNAFRVLYRTCFYKNNVCVSQDLDSPALYRIAFTDAGVTQMKALKQYFDDYMVSLNEKPDMSELPIYSVYDRGVFVDSPNSLVIAVSGEGQRLQLPLQYNFMSFEIDLYQNYLLDVSYDLNGYWELFLNSVNINNLTSWLPPVLAMPYIIAFGSFFSIVAALIALKFVHG